MHSVRYLLAIPLFLASMVCSAASVIAGTAQVIDGDQLEVRGVRVHLFGIDAPELSQLCDRNGVLFSCGAAARRALSDLVRGHDVTCELLGETEEGLAAVCSADGLALNDEMVREGWAFDYRRRSEGAFADAQTSAREHKLGVWSGQFEYPWCYRKTQRGEGLGLRAAVNTVAGHQ